MLKIMSILTLVVLVSAIIVAQSPKNKGQSKSANRAPSTKPAKEESLFEFEVVPLKEWEPASSSSDMAYYYNTAKMSRTKSGTVKLGLSWCQRVRAWSMPIH